MSNTHMDREVVWRLCVSLHGHIGRYMDLVRNNPDDLAQIISTKSYIKAISGFSSSNESRFLEWLTTASTDAWGGSYTERGIYSVPHVSGAYPHIYNHLDIVVRDASTFNFVFNEYVAMEESIRGQNNLAWANQRTCEVCETRFETIEGMHRHRAKCKGDSTLSFKDKLSHPAYRGNYVAKTPPTNSDGWSEKTSEW